MFDNAAFTLGANQYHCTGIVQAFLPNLSSARFWEWLAEILRHSEILGYAVECYDEWFSKLSRNVFTQLCTTSVQAWDL